MLSCGTRDQDLIAERKSEYSEATDVGESIGAGWSRKIRIYSSRVVLERTCWLDVSLQV